MNSVAIFGVGLIGGSFALALRKAGFRGRLLGVSSPSTIAKALELGAIDAGVSVREACQDADLLYLAQPVRRIIEILPQLNKWVRPDALVTDAGSTKSAIVQAAEGLTRCRFLGGHPLAGKESRGVESADPLLFQGRTYILTPNSAEDLETEAVENLLHWIRQIGSKPVVMDATSHDRILAFTSHLPQLASTALACSLSGEGDAVAELFGPGLLDATRLALSPYDIWADILATNHSQIDSAIGSYIAVLEQLRSTLQSSQVEQFFELGARFATRLRGIT